MNVIWYHPAVDSNIWIQGLQKRLPSARIRLWQDGDCEPADYAIVRSQPVKLFSDQTNLRAVFIVGAGVDETLKQLRDFPDALSSSVPLFRLEDTGMALQMQEYAVCRVLSWFRRFDDYRDLKNAELWHSLPHYERHEFTIGIMGAGALGQQVASSLAVWGFPVRCWSRTEKIINGVTSFAGAEGLQSFLKGTRVLINLLPSTPETSDILSTSLFEQLPEGAFLINLARGDHLVESDLLSALETGQIKSAALDVFKVEPLPQKHPFWAHPHIHITPHNAATVRDEDAMDSISRAIITLESGGMPRGRVDRGRGY